MSSRQLCIFIGVLFCLVFPITSHACNMVTQTGENQSSSDMLLDEVITKAKVELGLLVSMSPFQEACGSNVIFKIDDKDSGKLLTYLLSSPGPNDRDLNKGLWQQIQELSKVPREQLFALQHAKSTFHQDTKGLEKEFSISALAQAGKGSNQSRTNPDHQEFLIDIVTKGFCDEKQRGSHGQVYKDLPIKTIEYIPGRINYAPETIYQAGDLRKSIFNNSKALAAIKERIMMNIQYCERANPCLENTAVTLKGKKYCEQDLAKGCPCIESVLGTCIKRDNVTTENKIYCEFETVSNYNSERWSEILQRLNKYIADSTKEKR